MHKLTILIADDSREQSESVIRLMDRRFQQKLPDVEIEFKIAVTMSEAMELAPSANVTILDLVMPDSTLDQSIRSIGSFRPPVIVLTGNDDPKVMARCLSAGADHVFVKGQIHGLCARVLESIMRDMLHCDRPIHHASAKN